MEISHNEIMKMKINYEKIQIMLRGEANIWIISIQYNLNESGQFRCIS